MRIREAHKLLLPLLLLAGVMLPLRSQEKKQEDDKVRLITAKSAQLLQINGEDYRKVVGPARFLHNNTYLLYDTALWNVNTNIIDAVGHVRIIQDQTQLTSSTLQYVSEENMARFRGDVVQLEDKDGNTLRTRYLDYNTKDSVAVFQNGAAMRDKDGQVMESLYGVYDAKAHLFTFNDQVNMYMDTTFVKTSRLEYRSDLSTAYFGYGTDMWQDDNMLSANDGWYDRNRELFFFQRRVHLLTETQEVWADSMFYYRSRNDVDMMGEVELMDTTRNVYALAGLFEYRDSLSQIRMTKDPAVMSVADENGQLDTLYLGADLLLMRTYRKCDIPEVWVKDAEKRLEDIGGDPVMEYRRKAAEEAAQKAAEEAAKNGNNNPNGAGAKNNSGAPPDEGTGADTPPEDNLPAASDSLAVQLDTLGMPTDTLPPPPDTTKINFLWGSKNVKLFRKNMQMACDSLTYSDLDSLVRLYVSPVIYNEGNKQYVADSIYMAIRDREVEKAHLLNEAFITIQEAPDAFDQIRSVEMVAYFDEDRALKRFDALGGASSLFYLTEGDALATVNKVEAKMIYATFTKGEIDHIYYYQNPKNDGYPTVQLPQDEKTLKGFRWEPERQPKSPEDVTRLKPRKSERLRYLARPHVKFEQTDIYFPGYIAKLYRNIAAKDSLALVRQRQRQARADSLEKVQPPVPVPADTLATAPPDSLSAPADTLGLKALSDSLAVSSDRLRAGLDSLTLAALADSLGIALDSLTALADSLDLTALADSLGLMPALPPVDTLSAAPVVPVDLPPTPEEIKAREKAAREAEKAAKQAEKERLVAEKQAAREARWAEEDRIYAEKQARKAQKKLERERARKLKALQKLEKKAQKERKQLEKYLERERQKQARKKEKQQIAE